MRQMKESGIEWIGEIPEDWKIIQFKRVTKSIRNGTTALQIDEETEFPVTRIETISSGEINFNKVGYINYCNRISDYKLSKGDIVFSHINSLAMVGNCAIYDGKRDLYSGMNLLRIQISKEENSKWLFYIIKSYYFSENIKSIAKHAINQVSVAINRLSSIKIPAPLLNEKIRIANYLDRKCTKIDETIELEKQVIEKLKAYKQSMITEAVTKGLNLNVPMKDSGIEWIGEVPENWNICRLKNYAIICNGKDFKDVYNMDGEYPVMGSGGEFSRATQYIYNNQSVLLGRKGTIDKPIFVDFPFWTVDTMYYTKPTSICSMKYFYYLCTKINFQYYQYGSAIPSMTQRDLNSVEFPLPKEIEQIRIATYLDRKCTKIDETIELEKQVIEKLTQYKKSLIYEYVTGKREV